MTQQRATLSMIGLVLVIALVGLSVRYVQSLNFKKITLAPMDNLPTMTITSPAFTDGGTIPKDYTCDGQDLSPALRWADAPAGTLSYVLLVHDPDAPAKDWLHWLVINIPSTTTHVDTAAVPAGGTQLPNDSQQAEYGSPCPPNGEHRYLFEVYALDVATISANTRPEVEHAMQSHLLANGVLTGRYTR